VALDTATAKNAAVDGLKAKITHIAVFSTAASGSAGTELTGVIRKAITWGASAGGVATGSVDMSGFPAGTTIQSWGGFDASTGGNFIQGGALSPTRAGLQPTDVVTVPVTLTIV
jgi:hypothetical protein